MLRGKWAWNGLLHGPAREVRDSPINTFRLICTYGKAKCVYVCPVFHTCAALLAFHLMRPTYISPQLGFVSNILSTASQAKPLLSFFAPSPPPPRHACENPTDCFLLLKMSVPPPPFPPYKKLPECGFWGLGRRRRSA